jgi:VanZ family protein
MQNHINRWLQDDHFFKSLAIFATLVVVYLSLKPPSPEIDPWSFLWFRGDLVLHFICYFGLTILYFFALYTFTNPMTKSLAYAIVLGTFLETLQLVPLFQRYFDWQDLTANLLGGLVSWLIIKGVFYYSIKK